MKLPLHRTAEDCQLQKREFQVAQNLEAIQLLCKPGSSSHSTACTQSGQTTLKAKKLDIQDKKERNS